VKLRTPPRNWRFAKSLWQIELRRQRQIRDAPNFTTEPLSAVRTGAAHVDGFALLFVAGGIVD
jgi:hypothetical protein